MIWTKYIFKILGIVFLVMFGLGQLVPLAISNNFLPGTSGLAAAGVIVAFVAFALIALIISLVKDVDYDIERLSKKEGE